MADQIDLAKAVQYVILGPPEDTISVSKIVAYVILEDGVDTSTPYRQAHVYAQKITRA